VTGRRLAAVAAALVVLTSAHWMATAAVVGAQTAPVETTEPAPGEVRTRRVVERIEGRERPGFTVPIAVALLALAVIVQIRYLLKRAGEPDAAPVPPPALAAMARTTARVAPAAPSPVSQPHASDKPQSAEMASAASAPSPATATPPPPEPDYERWLAELDDDGTG
jgi:hypothetical protein